jgi:hypothetical protein
MRGFNENFKVESKTALIKVSAALPKREEAEVVI